MEILFERGVEGVRFKNGRAVVLTSFGESLPADLVVVGKGVKPNTDMVRGTAIRTNQGILVDDGMSTGVENVYAAGDVAEGTNHLTGEKEVIANWINACAQGEIAGLNMAGRIVRRSGQFRENITTLLGVAVASIGESNPQGGRYEELKYLDYQRGVIRKLFFNGPVLIGALLIGDTSDAGVIRHCIASGVDVGTWKKRIASAPLDFGRILHGQGFHWPHFGH